MSFEGYVEIFPNNFSILAMRFWLILRYRNWREFLKKLTKGEIPSYLFEDLATVLHLVFSQWGYSEAEIGENGQSSLK